MFAEMLKGLENKLEGASSLRLSWAARADEDFFKNSHLCETYFSFKSKYNDLQLLLCRNDLLPLEKMCPQREEA